MGPISTEEIGKRFTNEMKRQTNRLNNVKIGNGKITHVYKNRKNKRNPTKINFPGSQFLATLSILAGCIKKLHK